MEKKMTWVSWEDLCKLRKACGLEIKNLQIFNKALLCKWVWRFLGENERLWARVIRSRHGEFKWHRGGGTRSVREGKDRVGGKKC